MLQPLPAPAPSVSAVLVSGTVTAGDLLRHFDDAASGGAVVTIGPDFDGYLAELARAARRLTADRGGRFGKVAVVMRADLLPEASLAGLTERSHPVRGFAADRVQDAVAWVSDTET